MRHVAMHRILTGAILAVGAVLVEAQDLPQVFQRVNPSVVVVRAKGRDLVARDGASVLVKYSEVGSGVLVDADGKVLTAAHVVQIADDITVEFLGGESVAARVLASEVKADVALLQARWAQLRSGDEMTFKVFRAGRIIDLKGRVP
jgi:serine protease Do